MIDNFPRSIEVKDDPDIKESNEKLTKIQQVTSTKFFNHESMQFWALKLFLFLFLSPTKRNIF